MDRKVNYQKELDKTIDKITREGVIPTLFLHSCCAPCSSYVLKYLSDYFKITIFYYNPNISPEDEYRERVREQIRLINEMPVKNKVEFMEGRYEPEVFYEMAKGMEDIPEGGERCFKCYELRLREAAVIAKDRGFDYFTTTLSISPLKNAAKLNEIGLKLEKEYNIKYLLSDFKKKEGYKQSVELSKEYNLYRQNYCGCAFSKREALLREETVNNSKK
ncbi:epoxyqueuosine reductase QueH [Falcatimonas sp. MSJ-15]|uniref:epoxyqueuosine reductase QueH n=1 Tax=Falcatimonas sp. MSJ-15 TaxID=2841515 RepID=UPI001C121EEE|nr:epoxyqueuosine reductase QueH [Falcatimonas sp. MSJ-15]MBU5469001.1 epoxyqueuosine reductase QueH [Falcatimonas sp. MSJ-15]